MSNIIITSREQAKDLLTNKKEREKISAIISISDVNMPTPKPVKDASDKIVLKLHFDDMEKEMIGHPRCKGWEPPQAKHVAAIIEHAPQMLDSGGYILCHCHAGISRSSAAAFIVKSIEHGPGNEETALREVLEAKLMIKPNNLMVALADGLLGPQWHLSKALSQLSKLRQAVVYGDIDEKIEDEHKYSKKGSIYRI